MIISRNVKISCFHLGHVSRSCFTGYVHIYVIALKTRASFLSYWKGSLKLFCCRTVNIYEDPETPVRPVNDISWSPDSGSKMVVSYCFLELGAAPDYSNIVYIWQIGRQKKRAQALLPHLDAALDRLIRYGCATSAISFRSGPWVLTFFFFFHNGDSLYRTQIFSRERKTSALEKIDAIFASFVKSALFRRLYLVAPKYEKKNLIPQFRATERYQFFRWRRANCMKLADATIAKPNTHISQSAT